MESGGDMGRWREMFRGADIYDVIRNAILIAAADSPRELHRRRQGIVELLFAVAPVSTSSLADKGKATAPQAGGSTTRRRSSAGKRKRSDEDAAAAGNAPSKFKQHAVEKLLDEIDEDTDVLNEVLRIKEILINYKEQSEETLFDGLRRLELMRLSLAALKSTEIIGAVVPLGKHRSPVICDLVQKLKTCWKGTASDWVTATSKLDTSPNNTSKPYVVEGDSALPTPPMDMGAFFLFTWSTAEQYVSEFFIEADDDGNMILGAENDDTSGYKNQHDDVSTSNPIPAVHVVKKQQEAAQPLTNTGENTLYKRNDISRNQDRQLRQTNLKKPVDSNGNIVPEIESVPRRQALPLRQPNLQLRKPSLGIQAQPLGHKVDIGRTNNSSAERPGLEATKRKLSHAYQEAENERKKRCVQVLDLLDVSKLEQKQTTTSTNKRSRPDDRLPWISRSRR